MSKYGDKLNIAYSIEDSIIDITSQTSSTSLIVEPYRYSAVLIPFLSYLSGGSFQARIPVPYRQGVDLDCILKLQYVPMANASGNLALFSSSITQVIGEEMISQSWDTNAESYSITASEQYKPKSLSMNIASITYSQASSGALVVANISRMSTLALLHFDGDHGSTTITDSSGFNRTVTCEGDAQLSQTQKKFGTASLYLDGTDDGIRMPASTDWDVGNNDFTISMWIRPESVASGMLFGHSTDNTHGFWVTLNAGEISLMVWWLFELTTVGAGLATNTWQHIAITRHKNTFKIFVNGVCKGTKESSYTFVAYTGYATIGYSQYNTWPYQGYIDEFAFFRGVALWTDDFTPPTSAHSVFDTYCGDKDHGTTNANIGVLSLSASFEPTE